MSLVVGRLVRERTRRFTRDSKDARAQISFSGLEYELLTNAYFSPETPDADACKNA